MTDDNILELNDPEQNDPLQAVLREGARKLLAAAIESEVAAFIKQHGGLETEEGKAAVVRNGYLPERTIQTGLGDIAVKVPKVRDRSGSGIKFNSSLIPPYLKRTQNSEEFLPWLYLIPILNQNLLFRLPLAVLFILSAPRLLVIFDLEMTLRQK